MQPSVFASAAQLFAGCDWTWHDHHPSALHGFLERTVTHTRRTSALIDANDADPATAPSPTETLTCKQYIVYSPTFRVPTFYFTLHDAGGSPLSLDDLVNTTLFHRFALDETQRTTFGATLPGAAFPLLSQGDHPTLGTPCWFLHPCESAGAVDEIMRELDTTDEVRWLKTWLLVVGTVVHV